jgi:hypothetical protein
MAIKKMRRRDFTNKRFLVFTNAQAEGMPLQSRQAQVLNGVKPHAAGKYELSS